MKRPVYTADQIKSIYGVPAPQQVEQPGVSPGGTNSISDRVSRLKDVSLQDVGSALESFNPGGKIGEAIGTGIAKMRATPEERQFITGPSSSEVAGDIAQTAVTLAPIGKIATGLKTLGLGKSAANIATGLGTGYAFDVSNKFAEGKDNEFAPGLATAVGALPLAGAAAKGAARVAGETLGKTTGAGFGVIKEALEATVAGGAKAKAFRQGLRGKVTPEQITEEAKAGLQEIIGQRRSAYQQQLSTLAENTKQFDTTPVMDKFTSKLSDFGVVATDEGLDFSRSPGLGRYKKDVEDLVNVVENWGTKEGDLTITGIDKLKQTIDDFKIGSQESKRFDSFVTDLRKEAQGLIMDQPGYKKLVDDYAASSDVIEDIQKGLSLGDKAMVETSFKKLTTALRQNNDFRAQFVKELDEATGGELLSKISGQQLSELFPRGLSGVLAPLAGGGALATGVGVGPIMAAALTTSPRVVGEIIQALGWTGEKANKIIKALSPVFGELKAPGDYLLDSQASSRSANIAKKTTKSNALTNNISTNVQETSTPVKPKGNVKPGFVTIGGKSKDVSRLVDKSNPYSKAASYLDNADRAPIDTFIDAVQNNKTISKELSQKVDNIIEAINKSVGTKILNPNATDLTKIKQLSLLKDADRELTKKALKL